MGSTPIDPTNIGIIAKLVKATDIKSVNDNYHNPQLSPGNNFCTEGFEVNTV